MYGDVIHGDCRSIPLYKYGLATHCQLTIFAQHLHLAIGKADIIMR